MGERTCKGAIVLCLVAAMLGGCGGGGEGSDEDQVREVVSAFVQAGKDRDAAEACSLLSADQVKSVEQLGGGSCTTILGGIFANAKDLGTEGDIQDVRVQGERATVDATVRAPGAKPKTETILVVKEDGEWKLASAGF